LKFRYYKIIIAFSVNENKDSVIDISNLPAKMIGIASEILQSHYRPGKDYSRHG